jgi:hypothetical protein
MEEIQKAIPSLSVTELKVLALEIQRQILALKIGQIKAGEDVNIDDYFSDTAQPPIIKPAPVQPKVAAPAFGPAINLFEIQCINCKKTVSLKDKDRAWCNTCFPKAPKANCKVCKKEFSDIAPARGGRCFGCFRKNLQSAE